MILTSQRRVSAQLLKCGENRVWFDPARISEIKEAITKSDIRKLINDLAVQKRPEVGQSRFRLRKRNTQKRKGRQQGPGSRKGTRHARIDRKDLWMAKTRSQREFAKELHDKQLIPNAVYHDVYKKVKGGFFRSIRHIKLYLDERNLFNKKK